MEGRSPDAQGVQVRQMLDTDYDAVYRLWADTPGMGLRSLDDTREGIHKFLRRNPTTCFLAEDEKRVLAVILSGHDGRRGYIYHLAVAAHCRRQGLGKMLVERALISLRAEGINKVALVVFADNESGNSFWRYLGFAESPDLVYRNKSINEHNF